MKLVFKERSSAVWHPVAMKVLLEILLSIFLHPVAMVLMWLNVLGRTDIGGGQKIVWIVVSIIWGLGPIVYFLVGGGELW